MYMEKFAILDFGKVLAYPTTGYWFITPKFKSLVNMEDLDINDILNAMNRYNYIISEEAHTLEDEYDIFYRFYQNVFFSLKYKISTDDLKSIAYNITYENDKYGIYPQVREELEYLSSKYRLIMITDNWPCVTRILEFYKIDKYFEKIYISSVYASTKIKGKLFEIAKREFNIKREEAIFVDDNIEILKVAENYGLIPVLMDRNKESLECNYKTINNLFEI